MDSALAIALCQHGIHDTYEESSTRTYRCIRCGGMWSNRISYMQDNYGMKITPFEEFVDGTN